MVWERVKTIALNFMCSPIKEIQKDTTKRDNSISTCQKCQLAEISSVNMSNRSFISVQKSFFHLSCFLWACSHCQNRRVSMMHCKCFCLLQRQFMDVIEQQEFPKDTLANQPYCVYNSMSEISGCTQYICIRMYLHKQCLHACVCVLLCCSSKWMPHDWVARRHEEKKKKKTSVLFVSQLQLLGYQKIPSSPSCLSSTGRQIN